MWTRFKAWFKHTKARLANWMNKHFGNDFKVPQHDIDGMPEDTDLYNQARDMEREVYNVITEKILSEHHDDLAKAAANMLQEIHECGYTDTDLPADTLFNWAQFPYIDALDDVRVTYSNYEDGIVVFYIEQQGGSGSPTFRKRVALSEENVENNVLCRIVSPKFVAEQLGVTPATVRNYLNEGKLFGFKKTDKPQARWYILWSA